MNIGITPIGRQGDKVIFQAADDKTAAFGMKHIGEILTAVCNLKEQRDLIEHNRFHAILDRAVENLPQYIIEDNRSKEQAHDDLMIKLKYAAGFVVFIETLSGERQAIPRSESFGSDATQEEIYAFYNASYAILCTLLECNMAQLLEF